MFIQPFCFSQNLPRCCTKTGGSIGFRKATPVSNVIPASMPVIGLADLKHSLDGRRNRQVDPVSKYFVGADKREDAGQDIRTQPAAWEDPGG